MGFLKGLFSGGETVKAVAEGVGSLIGDVKTAITGRDPELEAKLAQAQVELNKIEAASPSIFIAGWRPFIGWTCGLALAWNYIAIPVIAIWAKRPLPEIDMSQLYPLIIALLGLGVYRTAEKIKGVNGSH